MRRPLAIAIQCRGVAATLVSRPFTLEQSHLVSSSEVVGRVNIPTGTYTKALLTVANPHVVFLDNFGNVREARWVGASLSTIILKQPISASAAPSVVRISLDIASLMKFDATQQIMLRTQPVFTVSQLSPGKAGADAEISGELEAAVGKVTAVSGSSFTVTDALSGLTTIFRDWINRRILAGRCIGVYEAQHSVDKDRKRFQTSRASASQKGGANTTDRHLE